MPGRRGLGGQMPRRPSGPTAPPSSCEGVTLCYLQVFAVAPSPRPTEPWRGARALDNSKKRLRMVGLRRLACA